MQNLLNKLLQKNFFMKKKYTPHAIEDKWYRFWEDNGYFAPSGEGNPFSVMIPPPNVTGSLHMGHAFQQAIMDALIRYQRMKGKNTLWQAGTDHAGIATQMVVERKLNIKEGKSRYDLGRDVFTQKIWDWKAESGNLITKQMRRLGNSVDWDTACFTMDPGMVEAVQTAFIRLYETGLAYRGKRLVNWDPKLNTAISDLEVENKEQKGHLWYFRYPLIGNIKTAEGKDYIVVATTRPETILGDSAVAVHPQDERYQNLIGSQVQLPLTDRTLPVIADDFVDMEFGTGCVKITPAHDFNDYEVGKRHNLPLINIMTQDAKIARKAQAFNFDGSICNTVQLALPEMFCSMDRFEARKKIIAAFDNAGLLETTQDHQLNVPYGDRSGVIIEPLLTDQWFIDTAPLSAPAIKAVEEGKIKFVPQQYENIYFAWMRDIQHWCISRQLWWGHRIPAWYDDAGNVYVANNEADVRKKYTLDDSVILKQDEDVFDTWFSSALWTFATLGWPENTERLKTFHPSDVLVTGFDIIFFWVARMIMMTLYLVKDETGDPQIPFKYIYIHGLIRDEQGQKMSKSKGNVLDPLDMIDGISAESLINKRIENMMQPQMAEKIAQRTRKQFPEGIAPYGADALRYTLYSMASTGRDLNWDMNRLEGYRNFCNKLWNASRYVFMHTENYDCGLSGETLALSVADRWIMSRLQQVISDVHKAFSNFRLDHASQKIYEFVWNEYCDWYLELSKPVLWDENASAARLRGTRYTLITVLETTLRIMHPLMPFITEDIWQKAKELVNNPGNSLMVQPYPEADQTLIDASAEKDIAWLQSIVSAVRTIRLEANIALGKPLEVLLRNATEEDEQRLQSNENLLKKIAKLSGVRLTNTSEVTPLCVTRLAGFLEVMVPVTGFIDKAAETERLSKEIARLENEISRLSAKLSNNRFVSQAPLNVVEKEKIKLHKVQSDQIKLTKQMEEIKAL